MVTRRHDPVQCAGMQGQDDESLSRDSNATVNNTEDAAESYPALAYSTIGRYVVLHRLGSGGMGMVYAAYDPELDRQVAVKLLRPGRNSRSKDRAKQRIRREAHLLAKLSHPHVVTIYDTGVHGDDIFIAMELVAGQSFKEWCQRSPRPAWRQILSRYIDAARGLAAAHAAGIIHRDFKPSNVLLGDDGRVRVADFGLAAASSRNSEDPALDGIEIAPPVPVPMHDETDLTRSGARVGTPTYMAPEQHTGGEVGALADQYSFCVALYEALYGMHPFQPGASRVSLTQLIAHKHQERFQAPPPNSDIPDWLRAVILRGMSARSEERWPSMDALISALGDDPARRRRWRLMAATLALAALSLAALAAIGWLRAPEPVAVCESAESELQGIWDEATKRAMQTAFVATELPYATDTYQRTTALLDAYADAWVEMHNQACAATQIRKQQSYDILALRMACLSRRKDTLKALTTLFLRSNKPEVVNQAVLSAAELPPVAYCGDIAALTAEIPPPEDPLIRAVAETLQYRLDSANALEQAGQYQDGLALAEEVLRESRKLSYLPLQAQAMYRVASLRERTGDNAGAEAIGNDALTYAARAKDDELIARAWLQLAWLIGVSQTRPAEALRLEKTLVIAVERADDELVSAELAKVMGALLWQNGDYQGARSHFEHHLTLTERMYGNAHPAVARALNNLASTLLEMGKYAEAQSIFKRSIAIYEEMLGPDHPDVATSLFNLSDVLVQMGAAADALPYLERALAIRERALGSEHLAIADAASALAQALVEEDRHMEAKVHYERALGILRKSGDSGSITFVYSFHGLGRALAGMQRHDEAGEYYRQALALSEGLLGPAHPLVGQLLVDIGELHRHIGKHEDAVAALERAVIISETKQDGNLGNAWFGLARALLASAKAGGLHASERRERAFTLAERARERFASQGVVIKQEAVSRWLSENRPAEARKDVPVPP